MKQLKNIAKNFFKSPVIVVFMIVAIFMLPTAINTTSIAFRSAIAVAVGIDLDDAGDVELSVAINISSSSESMVENSKVISSTGKTLSEAFANLNTLFGRSIKLGHTRFVIIGEKISKSNVTKQLDRLIRTDKMRSTVQLVYCPDSISEIFDVGMQLKSSTSIKLSNIVCHQQTDSTTSLNSNIDAFYKGYFRPSGISKINMVSISEDFTEGISASSNSGASSGTEGSKDSGGGESSAGGTSNVSSDVSGKFISNKGDIAIYENGTLKIVLTDEQSTGVNWLSTDYNPKDLFVSVGQTKLFSSATIGFDILGKSVDYESFFYKGIPFVCANILLTLDIDEIITSEGKNVDVNEDVVDDSIKSEIGKTIREQIANISQLGKESKLDLFELNNIFYQNNYKEYQNYLSQGHTKQDIIENTQLSADIEIKII